jgi:hypothetical protein
MGKNYFSKMTELSVNAAEFQVFKDYCSFHTQT